MCGVIFRVDLGIKFDMKNGMMFFVLGVSLWRGFLLG